MYDEVLFAVDGQSAKRVERLTLAALELQERTHLQEWVLSHPDILGAGTQIISSEYDRWQTSTGTPVLDRLDILAVDPSGRLVVVELKRDVAPHTVHMQAINYAAMVSRLTAEDVADLYAATKHREGTAVDREAALTTLETEYLLTAEGIRKPRIVLIASDFPASVTASVVWLNEQQVDISLIRYRVYEVAGQTLVSFNRLYPVPDVEEFTIGRRSDQSSKITADGPDEPWDEEALRKLADQGNAATLAMLDLCAIEGVDPVTVKDVAAAADISELSVRGQLAGLTMRLKNPRYGFAQTAWPVRVVWSSAGLVNYAIEPGLAAIWRTIRPDGPSYVGDHSTV